jgi:predicted histidine transporter YuiF (NhaC family)
MFIFQLVEACHQYNKHKTDIIKICNALFVIRIVVGLLTCSVKMYDSEPKLKVRTLDEMFKKISSTSSLSIKYDYKASNTSIHIIVALKTVFLRGVSH